MLETVATVIPARALSALVALSLSGAPALAVRHGEAGRHGGTRAAAHRCGCPAGRHDCRCPVCRSAGHGAHDARLAAIAELPRCHQAKALEALAREDAEAAADADGRSRPPPPGPRVRSGCDAPEDRLPRQGSLEAFVIPGRTAPASRGFTTPIPTRTGQSSARPRVPELPPPRCA